MTLRLSGCELQLISCGSLRAVVDLSTCLAGTDKDEQTLSLDGNELTISNGNTVDLTSLLPSSYVQDISGATLSGTTLNINFVDENGNTQTVSVDLSTIKTIVSISNLSSNGKRIGTITVNGTSFDIKETITSIAQPTWDSVTGDFVLKYTDENGIENEFTTTILPTFVNTDEQELTGDTTGNVQLTLTPVTVDGVTNYTIKADLKTSSSTPSGKTNGLKLDSSGKFYVEPETLTELKTFSLTGSVLKIEYVDELGNTTTKTVTLPSNGGSTVSLSNALSTGHKIVDITIDGTVTTINETITSLKTFSIASNEITLEYIDEAGVTTTKKVSLGNQNVTADNSGNLDVTVTKTTTTGVDNFSIKVDLPLAPTTPEGLQNGLKINNSGQFYADAPESSVVRMSIAPGTQQSAPTTTTQLVVNVPTSFQIGNTTILQPRPSLNAVLMKAGYDYEFSGQLSGEFGTANGSMSFQFQITTDTTGATGWTNRQLVGLIKPMTSTSLLYQNNIPQGIWSPTVDSLIRLVCISSIGTGNFINNPSGAGTTGISWGVKMIGKTY